MLGTVTKAGCWGILWYLKMFIQFIHFFKLYRSLDIKIVT
jgi:hypothetical protein